MVHNGIIENHAELREELSAPAIEFDSETDTEVIAHLVDHEHAATAPDLLEAVQGRGRGACTAPTRSR